MADDSKKNFFTDAKLTYQIKPYITIQALGFSFKSAKFPYLAVCWLHSVLLQTFDRNCARVPRLTAVKLASTPANFWWEMRNVL